MRKFSFLFECGAKVIYASDIAHPKALDQSESIDLIWAFDFHLSEVNMWRAIIRRGFII